jgi:hypothetical protein
MAASALCGDIAGSGSDWNPTAACVTLLFQATVVARGNALRLVLLGLDLLLLVSGRGGFGLFFLSQLKPTLRHL